MRLVALLSALVLVLPSLALSATIHVPAGYPTIQSGIDAASPGDTVLVACGIYYEHNIQMRSGVCLKSETGFSDCVTIDAESAGRGIYCNAVAATTMIEGFTIQRAFLSQASGGGINCDNHSMPTISRCLFTGNRAAYGGGVSCHIQSLPTIRECFFEGNTADSGGAIACSGDSDPLVIGCHFEGNTAFSFTGVGGAILCQDASPSLTDCVLVGNQSDNNGGALYCSVGSEPVLTRCIFEDNSAPTKGGAICLESQSKLKGVDCRFLGNSTAGRGGAVFVWQAHAEFRYCTFADNQASVFGGVAFIGPRFNATVFTSCTLTENGAPVGGAVYLFSPTEVPPSARFENSIIAFGNAGEAVYRPDNALAQLLCCDIFGNAGGDYVGGIADFLGVNGNFSDDPVFCDAPANDFTLHALSPCAPENSPTGCGLIGVFPVACGVTDVPDEVPSAALSLKVIPNPVRGAARFELGPSDRDRSRGRSKQGRRSSCTCGSSCPSL